jgi:ribosome biogenesis GTPase
MKALVNDCHFNNCMHINEPGCAVKKAINDGLIAIDRYVSYMSILDTMNDKKY